MMNKNSFFRFQRLKGKDNWRSFVLWSCLAAPGMLLLIPVYYNVSDYGFLLMAVAPIVYFGLFCALIALPYAILQIIRANRLHRKAIAALVTVFFTVIWVCVIGGLVDLVADINSTDLDQAADIDTNTIEADTKEDESQQSTFEDEATLVEE